MTPKRIGRLAAVSGLAMLLAPACNIGLHGTCTPTECQSGCCGADGVCHPGTTNDACGPAQTECINCTALSQTCGSGNRCVTSCQRSCSGKFCGPDGCGGSCGSCATGFSCNASGACVSCSPSCSGKVCGPDGCGGSCGTCTAGFCTASGQCSTCTPVCSGKTCGSSDGCNGVCLPGSGCTPPPTDGGCTPNCPTGWCGSNGCGVSCTCPTGQTCNSSFQCQCTPACPPSSCGPDGCGGTCSCPTGSTCNTSTQQCCTPRCSGIACGSNDGCGSVCVPGSGCTETCPSVCIPGETCSSATSNFCACPTAGTTCPAPDQTNYKYAMTCTAGTGAPSECQPTCAGVICTNGASCPSGFIACDCFDSAGTDVCTGGLHCSSGACGGEFASCAPDGGSQCITGLTCAVYGGVGGATYCQRQCASDSVCASSGEYCVTSTGYCDSATCSSPFAACTINGTRTGYCVPYFGSDFCVDIGVAPLGGHCNPLANRKDSAGDLCATGLWCAYDATKAEYLCKPSCNPSAPSCPAGTVCTEIATGAGLGYCK